MENETQNQDTQAAPQQQPVVEEAQAAPEQAMDATQAATSEVVHDDPGIPQQEEQQQGIAVDEPDPSSPGGDPVSEDAVERLEVMPDGWDDPSSPDYHSELLDGEDPSSLGGDPSWEIGSDEWVEALGLDADPMSHEEAQRLVESEIADGVGVPDSDGSLWDSFSLDIPEDDGNGVSESTPPDAVSMPHDKIVDPVPADQGEGLPGDSGEQDGDATPGGYDGSGIAGGLGLGENGMPENTGINPYVQSDFPGNDPAGQAEPPDSEAAAPLSPEAVSMPHDKIVDPVPSDQAASASPDETYTYDEGAYEDAEDAFEDLQDALQDGDEEDLAEALEELQGYLGNFDKGATEDENPDLTGADPEVAKDATGGDPEEDPKDRGEGVMEDDGEGGTNPADVDYREVLDDLDSGNLDDVREFLENLASGGNDKEEEAQDTHDDAGNNPDMSGEDYTYDKDAYEDAEDAMKDLGHALKHGDEEDRAEALQKLQGFLGGFDKGAEEEKQDGTETQDGKIPSDAEDNSNGVETLGDRDGDGVWDWEDDSDGDGVSDEADLDSNNDGVEDWMVLDYNSNGIEDGKEDSDGDGQYDWQDSDSNGDGVDDWEAILGSDDSGVIIDDIASGNGIEDTKEYSTGDGAAVSGPALGGAAVGAGAVAGEAGGLDEDLVKEAQDLLGDMFGGGEATNAITEQAGGAIDGTLGIEGSGEVIKDIANGNFDEALGTVTDSAGGWIGEQLGSEELGDTASEVFNHVANGDFEEAFDTAVEGIGDAAEDLWDSIWD